MVHRTTFMILGILSIETLVSPLNLEVSIKGAQNRFPMRTGFGRGRSPGMICKIYRFT